MLHWANEQHPYTTMRRKLFHSAVWPILFSALLLAALLFIDSVGIAFSSRLLHARAQENEPWATYYAGHTALLVAALVVIHLLSGGHPSQFGLRLPGGKSYVGAAVTWGMVFGVVMIVVDHLPAIIGKAPLPNLTLSTRNIVGWLSFEGLYAGTVEEIVFRGLLMTFLMRRIAGRVRLGRYDLHVAGIWVAVLFCLAHMGSFRNLPLWMAVGQQVYAFALALLYAYWYERSESLLAPIIGHNLGNFLEYSFLFLIVWQRGGA